MGKRVDFTQGNITIIILKQAVPLIIAQLAQLVYSIEDRVFIGHIDGVGKESLAGLGICFPIISIILAFTLLFGLGGVPIFSISRGEGDYKKSHKIMNHSFTLLLFSSLLILCSLLIFKRPILYALGASDNTYLYASRYLSIYILGTPFLMLGSGMNYYVSAQGKPLTAMITTLSGAVVNTILDPIFIFVLKMGIEGAAYASIISQFVSFVWVLIFFFSKQNDTKLEPLKIKFSSKTSILIMSYGITNFVMEASNCIIQVVCNKSLSYYGGDDFVMIMTVINSVRAILGLFVSGLIAGAQPVMGHNYGAKKYDRVCAAIKSNTIIGITYTAIAWLFVILCPRLLISLFTSDKAILELATPYLNIYFMGYIFMSLQFSGQSTFMALGKRIPAICFSIFRKIIIVVPLTLILPLIMTNSISGVFWAEPISNIIGGSASFFTMYFTVYKKLSKENLAKI